ncbi:2-C-methyl-D-erythritol 4-phosphate cytidylyltransferase [Neorhodopirellula pilleata]|uniref:2-C-methyl-D-erythritol 4-phosphate cytidylyltransferase n=1 Tax=Neorhodopirellula pilleata TaxID=2714738 RepID=A0A5C5ZZD8_9BACT|nr:2-C-methyl-D-erythritol 4-phosphate cytidylyltransferase [Neorhodopirellula pilleata]TWT92516.1 2-C-methyl-D-erythritol 4-phosphate cytidylyltransferase [Neorhodopirellula pilleata]
MSALPIQSGATLIAPQSIAAVLPAAGSGSRFGSESNKLFALLAGRPLWTHATEKLIGRSEIGKVILAVSQSDRARFEDQRNLVSQPERIEIIPGGDQRSDTVAAAIQWIAARSADSGCQYVAVHDAARPLIRDDDLTRLFEKVGETGAALLAHRVTGTLKRQRDAGNDCETVDREGMWVAQTPQVFRLDWIKQAYDRHRGRAVTDDAQMIERSGHRVALVEGAADNLKITYAEDLLVAEALIQASALRFERTETNADSHE